MKTLHALLVAINDYPNPRHALNGCINDMNALNRYLEAYCQRATINYNYKILTNEKATRTNLIAGFDLFQQAEAGDSCLFFYAGHGARWAAPEAFWHIEPDRYNESLVLYDSRTEGGRDLMDKELSYLIWKATHKRNVHFLAITDCCHSGTITRLAEDSLPLLRERRVEKVDTAVPLQDYLGIEAYSRTEAGEASPPRGRYVHLAASRASQTAKEVYAKGTPRGAFSYFLEDSLRSSNGLISYAELLNRININVRNQVRDQSPQLEATEAKDKNLAFLSGSTQLEQGHFLLSYNRTQGWNVNAGAMHQVQANEEAPTQFELPGENRLLFAKKVFLNHCSVEETEGLDKRKIYPVRMIPAPPQPLRLAFAPSNDSDGQAILDGLIQRSTSSLYEMVPTVEEAQYVMHCRDKNYFLTSTQDDRPLFKRTAGYQGAAATDFLNQLEIISNWCQLLSLSNPGTRIKEEEVRIELFRGTEPGNDQNDAPMELLDWREAAQLPYLNDGSQWHRPAFQLKVTNTGKRKLWFSILFMGDDFSVDNQLMAMQELKPGEYAWALETYEGETYRTHRLLMDDIYHAWGISRISDYFKVIISTHEFETHSLKQEGLELERPASPTRKFSVRKSVSRFDWTAKDIHLQIERPLPGLALRPEYPAEMFGISILPSESLRADARWLTLEEATAAQAEHFNAYLPDGAYFNPAEMGPQASRPGLCVLRLSNISYTDANAPAALNLVFQETGRAAGLQAYYWEVKTAILLALEDTTNAPNSMAFLIPEAWQDEEEINLFFHQRI